MRSRARSSGSAATLSVMSLSCVHLWCEGAMPERRKALAHARLRSNIDVRHRAAAATRQTLQYPSPIIHDHAVTVGLASARVEARLGGRHNITEILDRTCAQQRLPVSAPRRTREGRRHRKELRATSTEMPVQ